MESMLEKAIALGMTESEYKRVLKALGREPTDTEVAMFSVEWSEHCGYPRSRKWLTLLPRDVGKFRISIGSDAGGIEVEDGLWVLFKMESHNHPSQIEPKQGAATGIGGIIRDILGMGARPIALVDSLRFGNLDSSKARYLFNGVVDGIQFYGNCVGVPTVAGEVYFNDCYKGNCLVGVMCVGLARAEELMTSRACGEGNAVLYIGNPTGRDGIGGCSVLASHEIQEDLSMRPTVQLSDPFTEKCLIEACLQAYKTGGIVAVKDMGAAGLTCTTAEMSAGGGVGMVVDVSKVPKREADMQAWEIMMSESQERMLAVVERGREEEVIEIFEKWGLIAAVIGRVTSDGMLRIYDGQNVAAEVDPQKLANPPIYDLPAQVPDYIAKVRRFDPKRLPMPDDFNAVLLQLLSSPNIADKSWVFEQYDYMVQTNTVVAPGKGDAAVLRIKPAVWIQSGIAITADCNPLYCYLDPYIGAQIAVAEAARNLSCVGAQPAGVTDCLCFGNPDYPDRFWQFKESVRGIAQACRFLGIPVVSGNVSFYNESEESVIYPSPLIGMVGVLEDVTKHVTMGFKDDGDVVIMLGLCRNELGGSEYLRVVHGMEMGTPPALQLELEKLVQETCREGIRQGIVKSAHDCSEGGIAVALAECCIAGGVGAEVSLLKECAEEAIRTDALLFGESQSRIIVTTTKRNAQQFMSLAQSKGCPAIVIGVVGGFQVRVTVAWEQKRLVDLPVAQLEQVWRNGIRQVMEG